MWCHVRPQLSNSQLVKWRSGPTARALPRVVAGYSTSPSDAVTKSRGSAGEPWGHGRRQAPAASRVCCDPGRPHRTRRERRAGTPAKRGGLRGDPRQGCAVTPTSPQSSADFAARRQLCRLRRDPGGAVTAPRDRRRSYAAAREARCCTYCSWGGTPACACERRGSVVGRCAAALQQLHQPEQEVPARLGAGGRERQDERHPRDQLPAQHQALQLGDVVQPRPRPRQGWGRLRAGMRHHGHLGHDMSAAAIWPRPS